MAELEPFASLVAQLTKLPGVGNKTAQRYAYAVINMPSEEVRIFAESLIDAKSRIKFCSICGNYTDSDICSICLTRDPSTICVVKDPRDIVAFEKMKDYNGLYHVLHGTINPLAGIGANDIRIKELLNRLQGVDEIVMALNPDVEGEATSLYIARLIKPLGIKVSRLAQGIPLGSDIEFADENTLARAFAERRDL